MLDSLLILEAAGEVIKIPMKTCLLATLLLPSEAFTFWRKVAKESRTLMQGQCVFATISHLTHMSGNEADLFPSSVSMGTDDECETMRLGILLPACGLAVQT